MSDICIHCDSSYSMYVENPCNGFLLGNDCVPSLEGVRCGVATIV